MDMTNTIVPDSSQINAEDLLTGPRTFTITGVSAGSAEQPVNISLAEVPDRVYRPSKSMRRVLVAAWGADSSAYIGRRMTLYREPTIRFGRDEVGGLRLSHLSHIDGPLKLALTVTRGRRDPFVVQPLTDEPTIPPATRDQQQRIRDLLADVDDKAGRVSVIVGRTVASARDLDIAEAGMVIDRLEADRLAAADPGETDVLIGELGGGA